MGQDGLKKLPLCCGGSDDEKNPPGQFPVIQERGVAAFMAVPTVVKEARADPNYSAPQPGAGITGNDGISGGDMLTKEERAQLAGLAMKEQNKAFMTDEEKEAYSKLVAKVGDTSGGPPDGKVELQITNEGPQSIQRVFIIRPPTVLMTEEVENWGEDRLGLAAIAQGQTRSFFMNPGEYNLRVGLL